MPYPIVIPSANSNMSQSLRSPGRWPAYPDIPIFLDTSDQRAPAKSYGTTPTTPTTPETLAQGRPKHLSPAHINTHQVSPIEPSPTTTIETSSHRSSNWPLPEPPPEIQQPQSNRPTLRFFPTQRPRVRLDSMPSLQIPPINDTHPGLGIVNRLPNPPSIEISPPVNEKNDLGPNVAQRIEETLWKYSASGNILKRWLLEVISWLFSAVCMAAIIGVLIRLKDEPLTKWALAEKTGLTLNAYISILSKMAGAALILPVSEALGQSKWSWFQGTQSKEMMDFEIFDKASRGAWGSILLLSRTRGSSLAALGAVITWLMLATDTFFQQVTDLPERWILQGYGEIPRVVRYEGDNGQIYQDGLPVTVEDINLRQAALRFFYYNGLPSVAFGNGTRPEIPLSCPSSRCEWDSYDSLGICSACSDVSDMVIYDCLETKLDWLSSVYFNQSSHPTGTACGYWLNATSTLPVLMSGYRVHDNLNSSNKGEALLLRTLPLTVPIVAGDPFSAVAPFGGSIKFKDVYFPILDALIVSAADGTLTSVYKKERPVAQECMLTWCVKTFKSSYASGNYEEIVTSTFMNTTAHEQPYPWEVFPIISQGERGFFTIFHGNISVHPPWTDSNITDYGVSNETFTRTQALFEEMFPSSITVENSTAEAWWRIRIYQWNYNYLRPVTNCPWLAPNNITQYVGRLATALTNVVRSHNSHEFVQGREYTQTTFIAVHLEWLIFPLALLCLCLIFLVATMLKTSKGNDQGVGMWKTSAMPTLIYGLPKDSQKDLTSPSAWKSGSNRRSRIIKIRHNFKQGWRVSGQTCNSPTQLTKTVTKPPAGWI